MRNANRTARPGLRRARETAFALCTLWLVIQNCVLLAFVPWKRLPEATEVLATLAKTAVLVLGPLWVLGSAALLGWALVAWLTREPLGTTAATDWEIDHERAR